ncbi:hypothetical protein [Amphritea sp.]|uniref:hypothetical protein n=1 Tax=Amphritea sp. TaxID=1872502 RepID=UPI003D131985
MKHTDSTTSPHSAPRHTQWWFALVLLLVLVVMQSRGLTLEPLAEQLLSVNESNAEQLLLPASVGGDDQPCTLIPATLTVNTVKSPEVVEIYPEQSQPSSIRWVAPSPRAPPTLS